MTTSPLRLPDTWADQHAAPARVADASRECAVPLRRYRAGGLTSGEDSIAVEECLTVRLQNRPDAILSRTPGDDLNLIVGHLFCNGVLRAPEEVAHIGFSYEDPARVDVVLDSGRSVGKLFPVRPEFRLAPERLFELKQTFERRQNLFQNTGATHAAALFSLDGRLLAFGEDVGRHNAFDKAIGRALLEGTLNKTAIAMLSSRLAVELTAKAEIAGIPVLCGFSAATSSGVRYAERHDITLIGRLRTDSFDVYAHGRRIQE